MDLNTALRWLGLFGGGVTLFRGIGAFRSDKLWVFVGVLVVGAGTATHFFAPNDDGIVSTSIFALLVVGPSILSELVQVSVFGQKYTRALFFARLFYVLHPSDAVRLIVVDRRAAVLLARNDEKGANAVYLEVEKRGGTTATWAEITRLRTLGEWGELVQYFKAHRDAGDGATLFGFLPAYLRALGEIGERRELLMEIARCESELSSADASELRTISWLFAFAFAGKRDLVDRLLSGALRQYSEPLQAFWRLTADMVARVPGTREKLIALRERADIQVLRAIERRLAHEDVLTREDLSEDDEALLARMEIGLQQEERFGRAAKPRAPVVVFALIALNVVAYAVELKLTGGHTMDERALKTAGALYAPYVLDQHEWWRLLSCTVLHAGEMHIGMNMLGLYALGPFVERVLGRARFFVVYLAAGILGSVAILTNDWLHLRGILAQRDAQTAVGASGAIMGVVGATIAIALRGWMRERAPIARRQLVLLLILVVAQTTMDLSTPEISYAAHAGGLVSGFVVALLMRHHTGRAAQRGA